MEISIEFVPRSEEQLNKELSALKAFPRIGKINIPDLLTFSIRSWEAWDIVKKYNYKFVPHIRSIDFDKNNPQRLLNILKNSGFKEILLISGDPPQNMKFEVFPTTPIELAGIIKKEIPDQKIYGAIDPYRNSIKDEFEYIQEKKDVGFCGFFTQPFFDLRLMEIYIEHTENIDVYWGISPVTSVRSKNYWETRNRATFPKSFNPDLNWNIEFAKNALRLLEERYQNVYFMPIRIDIQLYLRGIFGG